MQMSRMLNLSLLQMMKAVAFAGVACACVAPVVRNRLDVTDWTWEGVLAIALFSGVAVPLAWIGLAVVLIRCGPWRDHLVTALLLCSASAALGFVSGMFVQTLFFSSSDPAERPFQILSATLFAGIIGILGAACALLCRRLWRHDRSSLAGQRP